MKKFFAAAIAVLMTASLAACGSTPSSSAAESAARFLGSIHRIRTL